MSIQWTLVFFLLLVGWGCGIYAASIFTVDWKGRAKEIRTKSMILSLVILVIGGLVSVLHLSHPSRIYMALTKPSSGIFMEALLIGLLGLTILIYIIAAKRNASDQTLRIIGTIGLIPAVILAFSIGNTYTLPGRPAWDTILLPLNYFVSAGVMGSATVSILAARTEKPDKEAVSGLNLATFYSLILQAILVIAYLIYLAMAPFPHESRSVGRVLAGDLAPLFWVGIVVLGLIIPFVLIVQLKRKESEIRSLLMKIQVSLLGILLGGVAFRVMMFALGSGVHDYFNIPLH